MNLLLAMLSGALLFLANHPVHWWWLTFVGMVPLWFALHAQRTAGRLLWPIGFVAAAASTLPLLLFAGTSPPIVAAAVFVLLQWTAFAMLAGRLLVRGPVLGPLAAAAVVTLAEMLSWYAVPIFGTAQCFARPMSAAPEAIAFVAYTGLGGLVFALVATQAAVAVALRTRRATPLLGAVAIVAVAGALDVLRQPRGEIGRTLRVAVHGWRGFPGNSTAAAPVFRRSFGADEGRVRLVVTPEVGGDVGVAGHWLGTREQAIADLGHAAGTYDTCGAIGVFDLDAHDNRIWFVQPGKGLVAEYRKTHLIPWLEDYVAGDGTLATMDVDGIKVGGMICQDDNFTDLGRAYGNAGVHLVAVPTNDWPAIREYHLENAIFRSIENGYAVARAASAGISALIDCRGRVRHRLDHVEQARRDGTTGEGMLVDDLPVGDGRPTLYARLGEWPMLALSLLLLAAGARGARRPLTAA
ncbi:MAG: nitrilase-related carbon-nitrogen hydrolase [Planctomycetota bacterium]